jgi:DNA helicase-2/ATP-dependent DNA helicase PcrA
LRLADRLEYRVFIRDGFLWFEKLMMKGTSFSEEFAEYPQERQTWEDLIADIDGQYGIDNVTLHLLLQELDLRSKSPKAPADAVPLHTIHASKGLEFDHVYLAGLVEDQLPSWAAVKKGPDSREMQEERRNCFVAITRAQESLTLTYSQTLQGWRKAPSRFLAEMELICGQG